MKFQKLSKKCGTRELLVNLKHNGILGDLLSLLIDFLRNKNERVILSGQSSHWANINADSPQGFILDLFYFLIYIDDVSDNHQCKP